MCDEMASAQVTGQADSESVPFARERSQVKSLRRPPHISGLNPHRRASGWHPIPDVSPNVALGHFQTFQQTKTPARGPGLCCLRERTNIAPLRPELERDAAANDVNRLIA